MSLRPATRDGKKFLNPVPTKVGGLSVLFKAAPRLLFDRSGRTPKHALGPFATDPRAYSNNPSSGLRVTWFGHSSSLIEMEGVRVLIDPVWDERAAPVNWFGPKRFFPPTIALADLPPPDVILISHDHFDHLGAGTIKQLSQMQSMRQTRWVTTLGVARILFSFGVPPDRCAELDWMGAIDIGPLHITALPARHFSGRSLFNRFQTLWASFAFTGARHRVYYGADSGEWYGFRDIGERFGPFDLTMLEIGAYDPLWADIHMGPQGAVRSFGALGGAGLFMPVHWGLFDLALHPWKQPIEYIFAVKDLNLWSPTPGLPSDVIAGEELRSQWWR